ncbi:MAG: siroheme synthase, partial [SAR324 cluster bacterium]|nr:siroheme synthase [SAR324 cluster bacterium]
MKYLPIFVDIKNKRCLVIGGHEKVFDKIILLLKAGSRVTVISSRLCKEIEKLKEQGRLTHQTEPFSVPDLEGCKLVIVATSKKSLRMDVLKKATENKIPVNVVDYPHLCTFTIPAIVDRSPLLLAVSTCGNSPTLTRIIRARLEAMLPMAYGRLSLLVGNFRKSVQRTLPSKRERRYFWNRIFSSPIIEMFLSGKEEEAAHILKKEIDTIGNRGRNIGQVCLVGAGPGDPDLLTLRALRLIQNADTIVYDRLVFPKILEYARQDAELIYVGKKSAHHTVPQEQINQKLVDFARQGKMVVRLKG